MRAAKLAAGLLAFALLNFVLVNAVALVAFGTPPLETDLHPIHWFFTGQQGGDSWRPMMQAYDFVTTPEGRSRSLYEKLFFSPAVKHKGFQYPPTALLAVGLSRFAGEGHGLRVLEWVTWACIPLTAYWVGRILLVSLERAGLRGALAPSVRATFWLAVVAFTLGFYPAMRAYRNGQAQTWINTLFAAALLLWLSDKKRGAGALVGLMCLIKPQCGVSLLWALLRRETAYATGFVAAAAAGGLLSIGLFGWAPHVEYLGVLSYIAERGESFYPNQSINGVLNRALGNGLNLEWMEAMPPPHPIVYAGTLLSSIVLLGWALWPRRGSPAGSAFDFAMVVLAATMASPIAWEHHYGVLLPIFALLVPAVVVDRDGEGTRDGEGVRVGWLAAAFVLTSHTLRFTDRFATSWLNVLQAYILAGAVIVLFLLDRERSRSGSAIEPPLAIPSEPEPARHPERARASS